MKAINIGKTILVWNSLTDAQASDLIQVLKDIVVNYRKLDKHNIFNRPVPLALEEKDHYLCIIKKHKEIFISSTRITNKNNSHSFTYNAIINGDYLYDSIHLLRNSYQKLEKQILILEKYPQHEWIKLPFSKSFETYCLSPNINPEDFVEHLKKNDLSNLYKNFLKEVGIVLENSTFSKELEDSIEDANNLFREDEYPRS